MATKKNEPAAPEAVPTVSTKDIKRFISQGKAGAVWKVTGTTRTSAGHVICIERESDGMTHTVNEYSLMKMVAQVLE